MSATNAPKIIRTCEPQLCCDAVWEEAYLRFETAEEEISKFCGRLQRLGANDWPRDSKIVEIFCGRGNGLKSLGQLGFTSLEGVDLSQRLLEQFDGKATLYVGDCRKLSFEDASRDVVIVQGGLHHLPLLPDDLDLTLNEVRRVLKPGGRLVIVEPWLTPFLRCVHFMTDLPLIRRTWGKLDALATMIDRERDTYFKWLEAPDLVLSLLADYFHTQTKRVAFGKLYYVGTPK